MQVTWLLEGKSQEEMCGPSVVNPTNGPDANDPDDGATLNGNGAKSGARTLARLLAL